MTETATLPDAMSAETAIATVRADPGSVLLQPALWDRFFAAIKADLRKEPVDLSTEKGRKSLASLAYKVTQTKTAVEKGGIALSKAITARRNDYVDQLEKLAVETRAPLTAWEEAETARKAKCAAIIERIQRMAKIEWDTTSDQAINALCEIEMIELDPAIFLDELEQAQGTLAQAVETMNAAITRLEKEEADKAELARLRKLEDERIAAEAEAKRIADEEAAKAQAAAAEPEPQNEETVAPAPVASEATVTDVQVEDDSAGLPQISRSTERRLAHRQSTVSEPSSAEQDARRIAIAALIDHAGLQRAEAFNALDAIIGGLIPNVTFNLKEPT